jgi:hypothetical protein
MCTLRAGLTCYGNAVRRPFVVFAALTLLAAAQPPASPTDFSGVWNYATMTPLERPREFADRERMTPEEAERTNVRRSSARRTPTRPRAPIGGIPALAA